MGFEYESVKKSLRILGFFALRQSKFEKDWMASA